MKFKLTHSLVAITMIASPLVFADTKIYAGADCDHHSGSTEYDRAGGGIRNKSASEQLVVMCPIVKDNMAMRIGGGLLNAVDRHKDKNVRCTIYSAHRTQLSNSSNQSPVVKTSKSPNYPQEVPFAAIPNSGPGARHYMKCNIPPKGKNFSYIVSYQVNEELELPLVLVQ